MPMLTDVKSSISKVIDLDHPLKFNVASLRGVNRKAKLIVYGRFLKEAASLVSEQSELITYIRQNGHFI